MSAQTLLTVLITTSVFFLLACVWGMAVLMIGTRRKKREQRIEQRLGLADDPEVTRTLRLWHDGKEAVTSVAGGRRNSLLKRFALACNEAGWETPARTILLAVVGMVCGAFALCLLLTGSILAGVAAAIVVLMIFRIVLSVRVGRRRTVFENQLVDALELAARSLRVGHPLPSAFRLASEEIAAPVGALFGSIVQQQELGVPLGDAMSQAAAESSSEDLKLFATAVIIQVRSGGNLADMMERVVSVMRDRMRLSRRVRVLITQTQFSKQVLLALPIGMFVLLNLMNGDYMRPLYTTSDGRKILVVAGCGLAFGSWVMGKIAVIKY